MDTRGLVMAQAGGVEVDATCESSVGLPSVPSAIEGIYATAKHSIGGGRCRTTIWFGDISDPNLPNLAITDKRRNGLKPYPLAMADGSGGSFGAVKILEFPKALVEIGTCVTRLMATKVGSDIAATFAGSFAVGTDSVAAFATPTSTLANILTSATIVAGVGSVSGSTTAPGMSSTNRSTLTGILDNSGGTASATIATIVTGATVTPNTQNAIAQLAAQLNNVMKLMTGSDTIGAAGGQVSTKRHLDGTSTAISVWYNSVLTDQSNNGVGTLYLEGRIILDWAYHTAVILTPTQMRPEGQG